MAEWVTLDDFETGTLSSDWSGSNAIVVDADTFLEGSYNAALDTDQSDYVTTATLTNQIHHTSKTISRNSNGDPTIRCLLCDEALGAKDYNGTWIGFFWQDVDNMYYVKVTPNASGGSYSDVRLFKVVSGTETELASLGTITRTYGVEIKAETSLITVTIYTDKTFTTTYSSTLTSTDTTYSSGGVAFGMKCNATAGQGIFEMRVDYIQTYDETTSGWTGTFIGVTNPSEVMGVSVSNISSVIGVS